MTQPWGAGVGPRYYEEQIPKYKMQESDDAKHS